MARKKNPRPFYRAPNTREQKRAIKHSLLKYYVRKMRPYFGDLFRPKSDGSYNLRVPPEQWSRSAKARVVRYWKIIAPQIAQTHKARYYRKPANLKAAVDYTQQEKFLPGQKAALFPYQPGESQSVKISRKGRVRVMRGGIGTVKVRFSKQGMIEDPEAEVIDALNRMPDGAIKYKIMMGPHESIGSWSESEVVNEVMSLISRYDDPSLGTDDPHSQYYSNWVTGLAGYYARSGSRLERVLDKRRRQRDEDIHARVKERAAMIDKVALADIRKKRAKKKRGKRK